MTDDILMNSGNVEQEDAKHAWLEAAIEDDIDINECVSPVLDYEK